MCWLATAIPEGLGEHKTASKGLFHRTTSNILDISSEVWGRVQE